MAPRRGADAPPVLERLQQLQAHGYGRVALGTLLLALAIGVVVPVGCALLHELAHALVARRRGLVGVSLPRLDRRRFAARYGFGLTRLLSARDPRGWVRLHPDVPPRDAVAILAAGPAADGLVALLLATAAVVASGTIRAVLLWTALDCVTGAIACLARREGGYGDGVVLQGWLARARANPPRPRTAAGCRPDR
jgi:hypothetical protein